MKNLRSILFALVTILLINSLFNKVVGQSNGYLNDPSTNPLSQEDLQAILEVLHINIFKFNIGLPIEQKCSAVLYRQEYEKRNLINETIIWGTSNPFRTLENGVEVEKALDQIRIISKKDNDNFVLFIRMGDFELANYTIKYDSIYSNPHDCKPFKLPTKYNIGDKFPLLLIGSYWDSTSKDGKMKTQRFCWELKDLNNDFSDRAFDVMPHYIVFGIQLEKQ
ncbi:MAG: hypothetical protein GX421_08155 [Caldisericales bacterium]|nr:hypothetical protein [Caldisericales bacterium]